MSMFNCFCSVTRQTPKRAVSTVNNKRTHRWRGRGRKMEPHEPVRIHRRAAVAPRGWQRQGVREARCAVRLELAARDYALPRGPLKRAFPAVHPPRSSFTRSVERGEREEEDWQLRWRQVSWLDAIKLRLYQIIQNHSGRSHYCTFYCLWCGSVTSVTGTKSLTTHNELIQVVHPDSDGVSVQTAQMCLSPVEWHWLMRQKILRTTTSESLQRNCL